MLDFTPLLKSNVYNFIFIFGSVYFFKNLLKILCIRKLNNLFFFLLSSTEVRFFWWRGWVLLSVDG